jgi:hypothetical protein
VRAAPPGRGLSRESDRTRPEHRRDGVTILSVSGDVVTARIAALQTDGTVRTYQGTYRVHHGIITKFDIRQVS